MVEGRHDLHLDQGRKAWSHGAVISLTGTWAALQEPVLLCLLVGGDTVADSLGVAPDVKHACIQLPQDGVLAGKLIGRKDRPSTIGRP